MQKPVWHPDLQAEQAMTRMGIAWEVMSVPFAKIDFAESRVNGARIAAALLPEVVEDYQEAIEAGSVFPRVVLTPIPTGYLISWGNQRCAALGNLIEAGKLPKRLEIEAYVTEPLDKTYREVLSRSGNVSHGARASRQERLIHAMYSVSGLGLSLNDAAVAFNISRSTLGQNIKAEQTRRELLKAGVRGVEALPMHSLRALSVLEFDADLQQKVASLAIQHGMTREDVGTAAKAIKAARSQPARLAALKNLERDLTSQARAVNRKTERNGKADRTLERPRRREFLNLMDRLVRLLEKGNAGEAFTTLEQLQFVGDEDTARAASLANKLRYRLRVLGLGG